MLEWREFPLISMGTHRHRDAHRRNFRLLLSAVNKTHYILVAHHRNKAANFLLAPKVSCIWISPWLFTSGCIFPAHCTPDIRDYYIHVYVCLCTHSVIQVLPVCVYLVFKNPNSATFQFLLNIVNNVSSVQILYRSGGHINPPVIMTYFRPAQFTCHGRQPIGFETSVVHPSTVSHADAAQVAK